MGLQAAAVIAVLHTFDHPRPFKIFGFEISLQSLPLLTLVGYSMNNTIVIFDRIRENSRLCAKVTDVVNKSINQTPRTILTSD
jgi:preprotein translocase subunit SecF